MTEHARSAMARPTSPATTDAFDRDLEFRVALVRAAEANERLRDRVRLEDHVRATGCIDEVVDTIEALGRDRFPAWGLRELSRFRFWRGRLLERKRHYVARIESGLFLAKFSAALGGMMLLVVFPAWLLGALGAGAMTAIVGPATVSLTSLGAMMAHSAYRPARKGDCDTVLALAEEVELVAERIKLERDRLVAESNDLADVELRVGTAMRRLTDAATIATGGSPAMDVDRG